jgi:hypothetical protein
VQFDRGTPSASYSGVLLVDCEVYQIYVTYDIVDRIILPGTRLYEVSNFTDDVTPLRFRYINFHSYHIDIFAIVCHFFKGS